MTINAKKLTEIHIHKVTLLAPDERFYVVPGARDYALSDYGRLYHLPSNHKAKEIHNKQGDAFWIRFDGDKKEKVIGVGKLICIVFFMGKNYILKSKPGCKKEFRWKVEDLYILKNPEQLDEWTRAVKSHRIPKLPKSQCGSKFKNRADFTREDIAIMYWNMRSRATNPNTKESKPRYAETTIEKAMIDNPKLFEDWVLKNQYYYPSRLEVDKDLLAFAEREEIINLLRYKDGKRTTIIFDERPFLKETKSLTIKDLNDVDSALNMGLDDSVDQVEKEWCISQWGRLRDIITSKMDSYERNIKKKKFYLWHTNDQQGMTVDDKRFMRFIDNCKAKISTQKFVDAYRTILAIQQLSEDGALFSCCKSQSGEYDKRFSLAIDNRDKLTNLGSKVIILDGTGDIAPEYKADYIKKVDCSQFNVPLRNLYIRCVDVKTGKTRLSSGDRKAQVAIEAIRKDIVQKTPDAPIFTFQQIESEFEDKETDDPEKKNDSKVKKTSHFGNIKGINSYRTCTSIVQVGLNRYQEIEYFLISNFPDDKMKYLKTLPPEKSVEEFDKIFHVRKKGIVSIHDTMIAAILTDTEQNLFRGAIRNVNFDGNFMFTMYFDTMMYKDLITCMKARYSGANFIEEPTLPDIDKDNAQNRKTEKPSASKIGFDWYDKQPCGRIFKRQDVKNETGLDDDGFKDWKKKHKNFFKEISTEKQGIYRKP